MIWLALAFGLLLTWPVAADMYPDASNAKLPEARANLGGWPTVDAVKDLGCVGDGVADNTACITAAVAKTGSPQIYFGPGVYMFNCGTYTFASAATIIGAGRGATVLKLQPGCTMPTNTFVMANKSGGGWKDITIDVNNAVSGTALPSKVLVEYTCQNDTTIDGFGITKLSGNTIGVMLRTGGCVSKNWHITNSYFENAAPTGASQNLAVAMGGITAPADFADVYIHNNTVVGTAVQVNGSHVHVTNNDISGWGFGTGIYQVEKTSKHHIITGNVLHDSLTAFDVNSTPSGGIELNGEQSTFTNNQCYNLGGSCVILFGSYNIVANNQSKNVGLATPQNNKSWGPYQLVSNVGAGVIATGNVVQNNTDLGGAAQLYSYYERDASGVSNVVRDNSFPLPVLIKSATTKFIPDDIDIVASEVTTAQRARLLSTTYRPAGATLTEINELSAVPTIGASATAVGVVRGIVSKPQLVSGFTGTIASMVSIDAAMVNQSAVTIPSYVGYNLESMANGNGITSGSVTNSGFNITTPTAAAGAGGTVINNGFRAVIGSGSSAGTTNRGLYITADGGPLSTNYAILSDSAAKSAIRGMVTLGQTTTLAGNPGELAFARTLSPGLAPGAAGAKLAWVCGTNAGTLKLVAYAGTSTTATLVIDNVGTGAAGC